MHTSVDNLVVGNMKQVGQVSEQLELQAFESHGDLQNGKIYSDLHRRILSPAPCNLFLHCETCNVVFFLCFVVHTMR